MNLRILDRTLRHHFPDLIDHRALLHAADGYQALTQHAQHHKQLDLVLLDIDMPGISGVQVAEQMRASAAGAALIIIACTTSDTPDARKRYMTAGIDGCVCKPIDLRELDGELRRGITRRRPDLKIVEEESSNAGRSGAEARPDIVKRGTHALAYQVKHFSLQEEAFPTLQHLQRSTNGTAPSAVLPEPAHKSHQLQQRSSWTSPPACPIGRRHSLCTESSMKLSPVRVCVDPANKQCVALNTSPCATSRPCLLPKIRAKLGATVAQADKVPPRAASHIAGAMQGTRPSTMSATSSQEHLPLLDRSLSTGMLCTSAGASAFDRFAIAAKRRLPFRTRTPEILMQPAAQVAAAL